MNKFAPIAFVLLLSCGAALWFLASDSLNFHIKNQLEIIGSQLSQQEVNVESVSIRSYQGSGTITNLFISPHNSSDLTKTEKPTFSIASIDLVIDRESLKEEVIIIESITINGLNVSSHYNEDGSSLEKSLVIVQQNIDKLTTPEGSVELEQQGKVTPRLLTVSNVVVKQTVLQLINDGNEQVITQTFPKIELQNIGDKAGSKGETIGIELFEKLLIELNNRTSVIQNKATKML